MRKFWRRENQEHDSSVEMSIPRERVLHGVVIKKLPIGKYLSAMQTLNNLPEILLKTCFPDMRPDEVIESMKTIDQDTLYGMLGRLLQVVPEQLFRVIADLTDADYDHIVGNLSPKELFEVLLAFWEANDLTDFIKLIKSVVMSKAKAASTGFKA